MGQYILGLIDHNSVKLYKVLNHKQKFFQDQGVNSLDEKI